MVVDYDDNSAYKLAKEAWVANCTGGEIQEIVVVVATIVTSHELWSSLEQFNLINAQAFWIQYAIYVIPVLLAQTVMSDYALLLNIGLLFLNYIASFAAQARGNQPVRSSDVNSLYKAYLTVYRAGTILLTCIAILAVDFPVFPRRFAKVETFGTSLMDVGVGSFVFSSGIVTARSIFFSRTPQSIQIAIAKSLRSSLPLFFLGFLRMVLTRSVDYQEHHSEYGLHWNFFFTLGLLPPFVALLSSLHRVISFSAMGLILAAGYQWALARGLQYWIIYAPRVDLVSANKEGICSFAGYLAIFLLGLDSGSIVFRKNSDSSLISRWFKLKDETTTKQASIHLAVRSVSLWCAFGLWTLVMKGTYDGYEVSRRMANLPYVFWVVGFNLTLLASLAWIESRHSAGGRGPSLLCAVNKLGLDTFLLANVLTGMINIGIRTLYTSTFQSLLCCLGYMIVVTYVPFEVSKRSNLSLASYLSGKQRLNA